MRATLSVVLVEILFLLAGSRDAESIVIDFDGQGLNGPSTFAAAGPAQTLNIATSIGNVQFQNGVILTRATFLPADETSIYGTASFGTSLHNPLVVTFPSSISNFFLDVLNGETFNVSYKVSDNAGHSATFSLVPNTSSGQTQIGFAATGDVVNIAALSTTGAVETGAWDFFIDNIHFNEALPDQLAETPEPASVLLLSTIAAGLGLRRWSQRRRKQSVA